GNVDEAASRIREFLANKKRCREIAECGREEILKKHLESHRAQRLIELVQSVKKKSSNLKRFSAMVNYATLGKSMQKLDTGLSTRAFLCALRAGEFGIDQGEQLDEDMSCYLILAAHRYDAALKTDAGARLIQKAQEAQPETVMVSLDYMRRLLNSGEVARAEALAKQISKDEVYMTFLNAERAIASLLAENS
ncbi:MAG: glycosyltransferase family 1 protein, partial [Deltaproteobacteria bacterium]|nr:glycosyltransferase family 1 protein [Deltaproteobacteria bacterium]